MSITRRILPKSSLGMLMMLALMRLAIYLLVNQRYGFHRDALIFLDNGLNLDWGYVAYPPLTPFIGRIGVELFGLSLVGIKAFAALSQCIGMVLAGLIAKELGGGRFAQMVTAIAVAIAPMSLLMGSLFQYIAFDYLWWVFIAYCMVRLIKTEEKRWWLGIGLGIGLGMMTKYTMAFFVVGIVVGVLMTDMRRHLQTRWLWLGAALSLWVFMPNLIWQIQHDFISLDFLSSIHERDVALGRTEGFLSQQLYVSANPVTLPLWVGGLTYFFFVPSGKRYRMLGWMYVVPLILFWVAEGRFYYMAPAYPMLIAGGAVWGEKWAGGLAANVQQRLRGGVYAALAVGAILGACLMLPLAPVNSALWHVTNGVHNNFAEQIGWPELAQIVAEIYDEKTATYESVGIVSGASGEAAALNLYGTPHGLPSVISPINSYWLRTLPESPPEAVVVVAVDLADAELIFEDCETAGLIRNAFGVQNEASVHPEILFCAGTRKPWAEFWPEIQGFN